MTIALGILTSGGILLAADSEETYADYVKVDQKKIDLAVHWAQDGLRTALITGAGSGHLIDAFTQYLEDEILKDARLKSHNPKSIFDAALVKFYGSHLVPFQYTREPPDISLILAYTGDDKHSSLYLSQLNVFVDCRKRRFAAAGIGASQAMVMLKLLLGDGAYPSLIEASFIASYVVHVLKQTTSGVGKRTDIRALHGHGFSTIIPPLSEELDALVGDYYRDFGLVAFRSVIGTWGLHRLSESALDFRKRFNELRARLPFKDATPAAPRSPQGSIRGRKRHPPSPG